MWQEQRFMGEVQGEVLAEMLSWLDEHEDVIVEFQKVLTVDSDGSQVYVVSYRARGLASQPFLT